MMHIKTVRTTYLLLDSMQLELKCNWQCNFKDSLFTFLLLAIVATITCFMLVHDFIPERMDEPSSESVSFLTSMMHDKALTSHAISGHFSFVRLVPTLAIGTMEKIKLL